MHTPLDGPSSMLLGASDRDEPRPAGHRHLTITTTNYDGSDPEIAVEREDSPIWPAEPEADPTDTEARGESGPCSAPVALGGVTSGQGESDAPPDPVTASGGASSPRTHCRTCGAKLASGARRDAEHCSGRCRTRAHRAARKPTPATYAKEPGR